MADELDDLFDAVETSGRADKDADSKRAEKSASQLAAFESWIAEVARPTLQALATRFEQRGHRGEIDAHGTDAENTVAIELALSAGGASGSALFQLRGDQVKIRMTSPGRKPSDRQAALSDLDTDAVRRVAEDLAKDVLTAAADDGSP